MQKRCNSSALVVDLCLFCISHRNKVSYSLMHTDDNVRNRPDIELRKDIPYLALMCELWNADCVYILNWGKLTMLQWNLTLQWKVPHPVPTQEFPWQLILETPEDMMWKWLDHDENNFGVFPPKKYTSVVQPLLMLGQNGLVKMKWDTITFMRCHPSELKIFFQPINLWPSQP